MIFIRDYDYPLPPERIAQYPLADREASKLLTYTGGKAGQDIFRNLGNHLPDNSLLVFNDTRVIRARILFQKPTGTRIEIFCLEPISPTAEIQEAFHQKGSCTWKCLVGNMKRWKNGELLKQIRNDVTKVSLTATLIQRYADGSFAICFSWEPAGLTFSEVLETAGLVPLPPYIERDAENDDGSRYQTVYAAHNGSVAAPTAGLHFTEELLDRISNEGHIFAKVTLHVGVGTFRPVTTETIAGQEMHRERIVADIKTVQSILDHTGKPVIAVGTTSARTIESLYWMGCGILSGSIAPFSVGQWAPYAPGLDLPGVSESPLALLAFMKNNRMNEISGETRLLIMPGYRFRIVTGLITNFHMPKSTLLLLVAALIGDGWRDAYDFALKSGFRFLSYGDGCLFLKDNPDGK